MRTMDRSTSLWIKGQNLSLSRVGKAGWLERKGKIQQVRDTPGRPLPPKLRWESNYPSPPLPSPTKSLDRKKAQA